MVPRFVRLAAPAALVLAAVLACLAALAVGGAADPQRLADPGAVVRYGLPLAKLLVNLSAAGTIGSLVLAAFALTHGTRAYELALDVAAAAAAVWTVAAAATGFLSFLAAYQQPVTLDDAFGRVIGDYLTTIAIGQAWLATTLAAAVVTVLAFAVRNQSAVLAMAVGSILALIPMALQGHSGDEASHDEAISAIYIHILAAAVWLGGLLTLALVARVLDTERLTAVVGRYSSLALAAFVAVVLSGYVSAEVRVGTIENLLTPYGLLVLAKVAALGALGLFGVAYRRLVIDRLSTEPRRRTWFWGLVVAELAFMGVASGVAAALARTATPVRGDLPTGPATAAEILTQGERLPPPVTVERVLTLWSPDLLWIVACLFGAFLYLAGVWRLRRRGDRWPVHRTVLWLVGLALLLFITNGGVNTYQKFLFSQHMLAHMVLGMMVPLLLAPAAPITLAMRAIRKRDDGSRGGREWLLLIVHSRYFALLSNPVIAAVIFVGSLWVFYFTPVLRWATIDHVGHEWMVVHFLAAGYLFVSALVGVDPAPNRPPYPIRLIVLLATMAFHAFFGLALMEGTGLLLADWYGAMGWGTDALEDQRLGGGIAWSIGEIPTVTLAILVAVMWSRSDDRETRRRDRKADRDGDAELEAYNAMLAQRAARRPSGPADPQ